MKIVILGSGTSTGIPEVGCQCVVCKSKDPRDKRLRSSALIITDEGKKILIDCGPDFRQQALKHNIDEIDAILITHEHYDHCYGLDDLRTIAYAKELPIYGRASVLDSIRSRMHYVFSPNPYPGTPKLKLTEISDFDKSFELLGCKITPIRIMHGSLEILAYRINDIVYITDMKSIDDKEVEKIYGAKLIIINALRWQKFHPSHQSAVDVLDFRKKYHLENIKTYLTHISHHAPVYTEFEKMLDENVYPTYDTMTIEQNADEIKVLDMYYQREAFESINLGFIDYEEALSLQEEAFNSIIASKKKGLKSENKVFICQHNPVFTLGLHAKKNNLLISESILESKGIKLYNINRGGDITYHGPQQLVMYPILDLESFGIGIKQYIDILEDSIIELLIRYNIKGEKKKFASGVWLDVGNPNKERKIAAIGVKASRYVTMHGLALNVSNDLSPFELINPCGFVGGRVSSMEKEVGAFVDIYAVSPMLSDILSRKLQKFIK